MIPEIPQSLARLIITPRRFWRYVDNPTILGLPKDLAEGPKLECIYLPQIPYGDHTMQWAVDTYAMSNMSKSEPQLIVRLSDFTLIIITTSSNGKLLVTDSSVGIPTVECWPDEIVAKWPNDDRDVFVYPRYSAFDREIRPVPLHLPYSRGIIANSSNFSIGKDGKYIFVSHMYLGLNNGDIKGMIRMTTAPNFVPLS